MAQVFATINARYPVSHGDALKGAALVAPLWVSLIAGTGGVFTPQNVQSFLAEHQHPIVDIRGNHKKRQEIASVSQHLASIREMFGLTMTEIAQTFHVTRQAAYSWLNGVEPRPEIRVHISRLGRYASELQKGGVSNATTVARHPLHNGKTFVEMLTAGESVEGLLPSVKAAALNREHQPETRASRVRRMVPKVSADEVSAPFVGIDEV